MRKILTGKIGKKLFRLIKTLHIITVIKNKCYKKEKEMTTNTNLKKNLSTKSYNKNN